MSYPNRERFLMRVLIPALVGTLIGFLWPPYGVLVGSIVGFWGAFWLARKS